MLNTLCLKLWVCRKWWIITYSVLWGRYEAVFYGSLGLVLMAWILFENTLLYLTKVDKLSATKKGLEEHAVLENEDRCLQLSDVRIPLIFVCFSLLLTVCLIWGSLTNFILCLIRMKQNFDIHVDISQLVLFNVAFFGTGNFASIASFEISSVYRFITIFSVSKTDLYSLVCSENIG